MNSMTITATTKTSGIEYYRQFIKKMVILLIIFSLLPILLINTVLRYYFLSSYSDKVMEHLTELIGKNKQNIDNFFQERLHNIQVLSRSNTMEQLLNEEFLAEQLKILQEEYQNVFLDLGVIDDHGQQIAYAGKYKLVKAEYKDTNWFNNALKRDYFISDVFPDQRGQPHFIITVKKSWNEKKYIIRATIDFNTFNTLVEKIRIGSSGFAFIVNKNGQLQTRNMYNLMTTNGTSDLDFLNKIDFERDDKNVHIINNQRLGTKQFIFLVMPLKHGQWKLVCQQEQSDAFSELYNARQMGIIVFLLGSFGIVLIYYLMSRKMTKFIDQAEYDREKMNEQVIESGKLASIGELAAGISHEINNPVAIIVEEAGWIQDLLEEEEFKDSENLSEFTRSLHQIKLQGMRCKDITYKLLSFARKTDPRETKTQINHLIEEIVKLSKQRARYNRINVKTDLQEGLPEIMASPSELQQVFLNLFNNAIDAIGNSNDEGLVTITTKRNGNSVLISITDNGQGIPKAIIGKVFEPFFTTKPVGKGTGIGLSICHGIIMKLGGEIQVQSELDVGTTFELNIPLLEDVIVKRG